MLLICFSDLYFDDKPDTNLHIYMYVHRYIGMVDNKMRININDLNIVQ
jgi:hypothetical protein